MIVFEIDIEKGLRLGNELRKRVSNWKPIQERLFQSIRGVARKWWESSGGGSWAPLRKTTQDMRAGRQAYYKARSREGATGRILRWTGKLWRSATKKNAPDHIEMLVRSDATGSQDLVYGTRDPRARYHRDGRKKGRRMAIRHPLPQEGISERIMPQIKSYILGAKRAV